MRRNPLPPVAFDLSPETRTDPLGLTTDWTTVDRDGIAKTAVIVGMYADGTAMLLANLTWLTPPGLREPTKTTGAGKSRLADLAFHPANWPSSQDGELDGGA